MDFSKLSEKEVLDISKKHRIMYLDKISGINIPFGCEIEFEDVNYNKIEKKFNKLKENNYNLLSWKLVEEDSLNPLHYSDLFSDNLNGGEIVSPILNNSLKDWNNLKDVCEFLKRSKAKSHDLSAAHIHFDNKLFKGNYEELKRLLQLWALYEDVIFRFSSGFKSKIRPQASLYSVAISNKIVNALNKTNNYDDLLHELKTPRTNSLSLYNFDKKLNDSFEVRCPNGTIDEVIWQNNINFFKHILESALDDNKEWDLIDYNLKNYVPCNYDLELYNTLNIDKACELADFIFIDDEDKKSFIKQYVKK